MKKRLLEYTARIDAILNDVNENVYDYELIRDEHVRQISFFQHERVVHLMVTLFMALLTVSVFIISLFSFTILLLVLFIISLVLTLAYIWHYYTLENGVQYLYKQYDRLALKSALEKGKNL